MLVGREQIAALFLTPPRPVFIFPKISLRSSGVFARRWLMYLVGASTGIWDIRRHVTPSMPSVPSDASDGDGAYLLHIAWKSATYTLVCTYLCTHAHHTNSTLTVPEDASTPNEHRLTESVKACCSQFKKFLAKKVENPEIFGVWVHFETRCSMVVHLCDVHDVKSTTCVHVTFCLSTPVLFYHMQFGNAYMEAPAVGLVYQCPLADEEQSTRMYITVLFPVALCCELVALRRISTTVERQYHLMIKLLSVRERGQY